MTQQPSPLGVELRWMRDAAGVTSSELAPLLHASQAAISRWETGKRRPQTEIIERWRDTCITLISLSLSEDPTGVEAPRREAYLRRLRNPAFTARLLSLRPGPADTEQALPDVVPMERDRLVKVLLDTWMERSTDMAKATPEEHCEALADAILRDAGVTE